MVRYLESERQKLHPRRFAVELGGFTTMALDGLGPALLPLLRLDWAPQSSLVVHLDIAGLGTRPTISDEQGEAELTQAHGLLGASYSPAMGELIRPFASVSAGALHTTVVGRTDQPTKSESTRSSQVSS